MLLKLKKPWLKSRLKMMSLLMVTLLFSLNNNGKLPSSQKKYQSLTSPKRGQQLSLKLSKFKDGSVKKCLDKR